jgi:hypothetical protein
MFNLSESRKKPRIIRKLTVANPDSQKAPLWFEVGQLAANKRPSLGIISAIVFEEAKSLRFNSFIHRVVIRKPNDEEYDWKEIHSKDIFVEFDVD